jgi:hypothetical protein
MEDPMKLILGGYLFLENPDAYKPLEAHGFPKDPEDAFK